MASDGPGLAEPHAGNFSSPAELAPMPDLLVPLYSLPPREAGAASVRAAGIIIRRANPFEQSCVSGFICKHFAQGWADEVGITFARQPITCFLAIEDGGLRGFAAYEATRKAFFGPTGVDSAARGRGIGRALLIESLWGLHDLGYAYGIIGAAGPVAFYEKAAGARVIEGSWPGIFADLLQKEPTEKPTEEGAD